MNHNCEIMHETIVRDIIDVIEDIKSFDQVEWINSKNRVGSIARRANNLVLVFPVIVSTSLSIQAASIISKAIERKCVALLQILFSSIQFKEGINNLDDYLQLFHQNLNRGMSFDEFLSAMDRLSESGEVEIVDKDMYDAVKEDMQNINFTLSNEYNSRPISDYRVKTNAFGENYVVLAEARNNKPAAKAVPVRTDNNINKDSVDYFKYQLSANDIQKANELMPTTMIVNFTSIVDNQKVVTTGMVGVKAKMYPVDSMDIINRIASKVTDSNSLFNLVRATTREISFFRDLAFAIDKAQTDAINMGRDSSNAKIFKLLERRAAKNRFSTLLKKNDASPITTLVLSQNEVEYLRKYNTIDMEKSYVTKTLLEKYNLMCITLVDESLEVARFLYDDGDGVYETVSFDALEKETKDGSYKKVINLMSKMNR